MNNTLSQVANPKKTLREVPSALLRRFPLAPCAPISLRLIVGYGFMAHGFAKLAKGPDVFATILYALGVHAPHFMAWVTILIELFGGLAVILGAFVTFVSLPMAVILLVAMFTVHLPYGFSSIKLMAVTPAGAQFGPPGYEVDLMYLACLAALVLGGQGPWAMDGLKRHDQKSDYGRSHRMACDSHRYPMTTRISGSRPLSASSDTTAANSGRRVSRGISANTNRA